MWALKQVHFFQMDENFTQIKKSFIITTDFFKDMAQYCTYIN